MCIGTVIKNRDEYNFWSRILGKDILDILSIEENACWPVISQPDIIAEIGKLKNEFLISNRKNAFYWCQNEAFYFYYQRLLSYVEDYLFKKFNLSHVIHVPELIELLLRRLLPMIKEISIRCLVDDLDHVKKDGRLEEHEDPEQEYQFYCTQFLTDWEHQNKIFEKYPVMLDRIMEQVVFLKEYMSEFLYNFENDWEQICSLFGFERSEGEIINLDLSTADSHFSGKSVIIVTLKNGKCLVYKPHSLKGEIEYQQFYRYLAKQSRIAVKTYAILDRGHYGWVEFIAKSSCDNEGQVKRYFERMGIQLFISYILSTTDLHFENIIACGEFPVFVDLETFPGIMNGQEEKDIFEKAAGMVKNSVLASGILPVSVWNNKGEGVTLGAVGPEGKQKASFKLPCIINDKTSEMRVSYYYPEINVTGNLPVLDGVSIDPRKYEKDMSEGFAKAYLYVLNHRSDVKKMLSGAFRGKSRYLCRQTQIYNMYLSSSVYPDFMTDEDRQRLFFMKLFRGCPVKREQKLQFVSYEAECLLHRDIPYFYTKGDSSSLYDGADQEYPRFFAKSPYEMFETKMGALCQEDMERQIGYIRLSLALLPSGNVDVDKMIRNESEVFELNENIKHGRYVAATRNIGDWLINQAIYNDDQTEVIWNSIKFWGNNEKGWSLTVQDLYLYDGLAGTGIFFAMLYSMTKEVRYRDIFGLIRGQLFRYTDHCQENKPMTQATGLFAGEASLVYTYLLLYDIFSDDVYLDYAEKHCKVLERLYAEDKNQDLLAGNAGAIIAIVKLYELNMNKELLNLAVRMGNRLIEQAISVENGIGWRIEGEEQLLAGLSHGASGFLVAFAYLYRITKDSRYLGIMEDILNFEDDLYDEEANNWMDRRTFEGTSANKYVDTVAWCHGAAGILVARCKLRELCPEFEANRVQKDIEHAQRKLASAAKMNSNCLCHGAVGNHLIDSWSQGIKPSKRNFDYIERVTLRELYNAGLMTGVSGVGYGLLHFDGDIGKKTIIML